MKYSINLAQKKKKNIIEQVTFFFSNYLRYILVLTQLVVIGVLFYRFRVDQSIIDLKERIDDKKVIIKETAPFVVEAKKIETQSKNIQAIISENSRFLQMLQYIFSQFPQDANLSRAQVTEKTVSLTGKIQNAKHLQQYILLLKNDGRFATIELPSLVKAEDGFTFILTLNNYKVKN